MKDGDDDTLNPGVDLDDSEDDSSPLFHQPGKTGFYSPRPGKCTEERLNCFRNVGRCVVVTMQCNIFMTLPESKKVRVIGGKEKSRVVERVQIIFF